MMKNAVIPATSHGTCLQPLTCDLTTPMMESIVEHLARQGVRKITISGANRVSHEAPAPRWWRDARRRATRLQVAA